MKKIWKIGLLTLGVAGLVSWKTGLLAQIGVEVAVPVHLQDGQEFTTPISQVVAFGQTLFTARWTAQEGQGRPLDKGTGKPLSDPSDPLVFPHRFNRVSGPDTQSCSGCHNLPIAGSGGDIVGGVFVLGQRFDFATFDRNDPIPTKGAVDELGNPVTFQTISDFRKTIGMNGSGFIEMLARQMTADLQAIAAGCASGNSCALVTKGVSFGTLTHNADGTWNTSQVVGLPAPAVATTGTTAPTLILQPFHQAGAVISIRQFTNNAFNHHHGIQSEERFGLGVDADGDGFVNELTRADVTAASIFQATLAPPGRMINTDPMIRAAVIAGEAKFDQIGCATCHIDSLPLTVDSQGNQGWIYSEPNPYNPSGNLQINQGVPSLSVDLTDRMDLPTPRLQITGKGNSAVVNVPGYTDLKLHNITSGPTDPNCEPLNQNQPAGSTGFFAGNCSFLTAKLWGRFNSGPFMHHGQFTTMREAVLAHAGEAAAEEAAFAALSTSDQNNVIEFLKSLVTLQSGNKSLCVDQNFKDIPCPAGVRP